MKNAFTKAAVKAYFGRIESGEATAAEFEILPAMLARYDAPDHSQDEAEPAQAAPMETGAREFPKSGLVTADEVCGFLGRYGLKNPTESLMRQARAGVFPVPFHSAKPYKWRAEDIWSYVDGMKAKSAKGRRAA